jgi:hypothetical protein
MATPKRKTTPQNNSLLLQTQKPHFKTQTPGFKFQNLDATIFENHMRKEKGSLFIIFRSKAKK